MEQHKVVSPEEWLDAISAEQRALPWVTIEKEYVFDAPEGRVTLSDLFDGRSHLIVKH
jgi:predicted dithiol-disulfide oxidoreductase (DUF899 family)